VLEGKSFVLYMYEWTNSYYSCERNSIGYEFHTKQI